MLGACCDPVSPLVWEKGGCWPRQGMGGIWLGPQAGDGDWACLGGEVAGDMQVGGF